MTSTGTQNRQHKEGHISLLELKLDPRFTRNAMHKELQFWWVELHLAVIKESLKAECQRIWVFAQHRVHLQGLRVVQFSYVACVTDSLKVP